MARFQVSPAIKTLAGLHDPLLTFVRVLLMDHGFELPKDGPAAREWCHAQALGGNADAQLAFAQLLMHGLFGTRKPDEALAWIRRAADQSHAAAMVALSPYIEMGAENCARDSARAIELVKAAAEKGYAPAWALMGIWHQFGILVAEDAQLAIEYHGKAAALGFSTSQYTLGCLLIELGGSERRSEGLALIESAARQGLYLAHETLGRFLARGEAGLPVDLERSQHHYRIARNLEDEAGAEFGALQPGDVAQ